jgi:hypothetical protein
MREVICLYLFLLGVPKETARSWHSKACGVLPLHLGYAGAARETGKERKWAARRPETLHASSQLGMVPRSAGPAPAAFRINALENPRFDEELRFALRKVRRCRDTDAR